MNTHVPDLVVLLARAREVLDANWKGHFTVPAQRQYLCQWAWDSAFIAKGYARYDLERAEQELRSLFAVQWRDGRAPHIVFHNATPTCPTFLAPFSDRLSAATRRLWGSSTSGIVQPPVHAIAVLHLYRCATAPPATAAIQRRARTYVAEMFPRLVAWHDYLYRERDPHGEGLVVIYHPWESGQDNSPLWDPVLQRMNLRPEQVPSYRRADTQAVAAAERPLDFDYDHYIFLVDFFRQRACDDRRILADGCPFVVQDVLFDTLFCRAEQDLAELAQLLGEDPTPFKARATRTAAAINRKL
ncbi:MAG: hypothetical protein KBH71_07675 [Anaerolineae bacterium]|nr:hypothetical protein [Anaerolineae bacterium]HXK43662.1 hypothetical protein [Anaerolineae bacterium]